MSDREPPLAAAGDAERSEPHDAETAKTHALPSPAGGERFGGGAVAIGLAAALLLVVGLIAMAPLWAPLLPWGPAADRQGERALAMRLDRLEAAQAQAPQQLQQQLE